MSALSVTEDPKGASASAVPRASKAKTGRRKSQLDATEIKRMKEAFSFFDKNDDGEISTDEIGGVMRTLGYAISDEELKDIMNDLDENGDGIMDFDEFVVMMDRRMSATSHIEEIRETFKVFDKKGDGKIDAEELKETLTSLGEEVTDKDVEAMIRDADKTGDGCINFAEFMDMMLAGEDADTKKELRSLHV